MKAGLRQHTKLTGELVWAWNELHRAYARAFYDALDADHPWMGNAIWAALNNDSAQRDILSALLMFGRRSYEIRIEWALKQTRKLVPYRNDAVHGAMIWTRDPENLKPAISHSGNPLKSDHALYGCRGA